MSDKPYINVRSLILISLLGCAGGTINAWWCYTEFPVSVTDFSWHIVPVGAVHGMLLAFISLTASILLWDYKPIIRWIGLPIVGWLAGWLSYVPISWYLEFTHVLSGFPALTRIIRLLFWPLTPLEVETLWVPYQAFGLVASVYYLLLNLCRFLTAKRLMTHLLVGSASGILGSLWWWINVQPWYVSLAHGTIWGSIVGFGAWRSQQVATKPT